MYFVDNNTGVPVMPPVKEVLSSSPLFFTEGGNGVPPTWPGPDWFNIIQSELINFLAAYGLNPEKSNLNQLQAAVEEAIRQKATESSALLTAIAALVTSANQMPYFTGEDEVAMTALTAFAREILAQTNAAGVLSKLGLGNLPTFGTAASKDVGTGAGQIPDMSAWTSNNGTGSGWRKSPDGTLVNFGYASAPTAGPVSITFPAAFPNGIRSVSITPVVLSPSGTDSPTIGTYNNSGMTVNRRNSSAGGAANNASWDFFWTIEGH